LVNNKIMAEKKEGFFSQIKNQIITAVGVVITAAGGLVVANLEAIFSPETEVAVVDTTKVETPQIVINIPEQKTETKTIIKEVPVKEKKEKEQDIIW